MKNIQENIMAKTPIKSLIIKIASPLLFSFIVEAIYVLVDSYFISKLSMNSFSAMGIGTPVFYAICAIAAGTGIGVNANVSKALGEGDQNKIKSYVSGGLFISIFAGIVIAIASMFLKPFFAFQTNNAAIISEGIKYLLPYTTLSCVIFVEFVLCFLLTSSGKTHLTATASIMGTIFNAILDPLFMFVFGWGIMGASIATVMSFALSALICLYFNVKHNKEVPLVITKPHRRYIKDITKIGLPTFIMRILFPIAWVAANFVFVKFSIDTLNVLIAYERYEALTLAPIHAINSAIISIIAYNLGARADKRVRETIKNGIIYATISGILGFAIYLIFSQQMLYLFGATPNMYILGVYMMPLLASNFTILGIRMPGFASLQALGKPNFAMWILLIRQFLIVIPLLFIALYLSNIYLACSAWLISEVPIAILTLIAIKKAKKEVLS